jgi:hypothetical protein
MAPCSHSAGRSMCRLSGAGGRRLALSSIGPPAVRSLPRENAGIPPVTRRSRNEPRVLATTHASAPAKLSEVASSLPDHHAPFNFLFLFHSNHFQPREPESSPPRC